jgi:hypothetical protein
MNCCHEEIDVVTGDKKWSLGHCDFQRRHGRIAAFLFGYCGQRARWFRPRNSTTVLWTMLDGSLKPDDL